MKMVPLGEVAELQFGGAFKSAAFRTDGVGLPIARIRDVKRGLSNTYYLGEYDEKYLIEYGDYLIGMDGEFNLGRWRGERGLLNQRVCKIGSLHPSIEIGYLTHFLPRSLKLIEDATPFATVKHLSAKTLKQLQIPLPPLDEQRRIAAILDKADAIRQKRRQAIAHLDTLTQSIFHEMFGSTQEFKTVSELASHESRSIRTGPFGSQLLHEEFTSEGAPVLGIDNVVDNHFKWKQRRFIDEAKFRQLAKYEVFAGDVLITIMGTTGRCAVVPENIPRSINTKHLCAITPNINLILPDFLQTAFLNHPRTQRFLKDNTRGAIMAGLNMGIIKQTPIPAPPVARQEEFVNQIRRIEYVKSQMNTAHETALFASLQSRAFQRELQHTPAAHSIGNGD